MAKTDQFIQKTDAFMDRTEMRMQNQEATLKSLENQVGQISQVFKTKPMGGFSGDTKVAKGATHKHYKAIATRSRKKLSEINKDNKGKEIVGNTNALTMNKPPIILGRPFLPTGRVLIDFENGELVLRCKAIYAKAEFSVIAKPSRLGKSCEMNPLLK
ncbi:hypothetical protein GQ457_04G016330 [Hibiscus cannabinus]